MRDLIDFFGRNLVFWLSCCAIAGIWIGVEALRKHARRRVLATRPALTPAALSRVKKWAMEQDLVAMYELRFGRKPTPKQLRGFRSRISRSAS
jgi:hypothetical protein